MLGCNCPAVQIQHLRGGPPLELGLYVAAKDEKGRPKLIVACPEEFYQIGNVEIICERAGITVIDTYDQFVVEVRKRLGRFDEILPIETGKKEK